MTLTLIPICIMVWFFVDQCSSKMCNLDKYLVFESLRSISMSGRKSALSVSSPAQSCAECRCSKNKTKNIFRFQFEKVRTNRVFNTIVISTLANGNGRQNILLCNFENIVRYAVCTRICQNKIISSFASDEYISIQKHASRMIEYNSIL